MYNIYHRLNSVFAYAVTVMMVAAGVISLYTPWLNAQSYLRIVGLDVVGSGSQQQLALPSLLVDKVELFMDKDPLDYFQQAKKEHARLKLELTADLSPLFHWNCKQLYVWLQMEYENDRYDTNQLVIWDEIIRRPEDAVFDHYRIENQHPVSDIKRALKNQQARLSLHWEIAPYFGPLTRQYINETAVLFKFPDSTRSYPPPPAQQQRQ